MRRVRAAAAAGVLALTVLLTGCSGTADSGTESDSGATITVFAAASLKSTFTELGRLFEAEHPDTRVVFDFAGSSDLFTRIDQGAPADVFASADTANMTKAVRAGLTASDPVNFATNTLTIVTPPGNRAVSRRSPTWRDRAWTSWCARRRCRAATRPSASRI